jgi:hypothetical protein
VTLLAHMPGHQLSPELTSLELDGARLTHLTWEEWRAVDDSYPFQERRYAASRPLFLLVEEDRSVLVVEEGRSAEDDLEHFMTGTAARVHHALTMRDPHCPRIPAPVMSMGYQQLNGTVVRTVGPLEREAIVWQLGFEPAEPLAEGDVDGVRLLVRLLEATPTPSSATVLLDVLEVTGRPDVDHPTGFVLCVAALEVALLPDTTSQLRATFARRVAAMATAEPDELTRLDEYASALYRLRSEIVHGGVRASTLESLDLPSADYIDAAIGRDLVRPVVIRLAALLSAGIDPERVPDLLDVAASDPDALHALDAAITTELRRHV